MAVPAALRKQVAASRDLADTLAQQAGNPTHAQLEGDDAPATARASERPPELTFTPSNEPAPPQQLSFTMPGVDEPPQQHAQPDIAALEQRFRTLQGKYNSELPALRDQNRALAEQIRHFEEFIAQQQQVREPPPAPPQLVSEQEVTDFGVDGVNFINRLIAQQLMPYNDVINNLMTRLTTTETVTGSVGTKIEETSTQLFYDRLALICPEWEQINRDEGFRAWASETDPFSNVSRADMLRNAYELHDPVRASKFFLAYLAEHANAEIIPGQPQPTATGQPTRRTAPARQSAGNLVAPGRSRSSSGAPGNGNGATIWSRSEIRQFYDAVARKQITPEQARAFEADIMAATREGRIIG